MANGLAEKRGGPGLKNRHLSDTAGIERHKINLSTRYAYDDFKNKPMTVQDDGTATSGTSGEINLMNTGKNVFEYLIIGTQTVTTPVIASGGLDIKLDDGAAGSDGAEFTLGITSQSQLAFTAGTDACYAKLKLLVTDTSGFTEFRFGFRLAEAYQATFASYDTYSSIGFARTNASTSTDIKLITELDGGGQTTTDTTEDITDGDTITFGCYMDKGGNIRYTINGHAPTATAAFQFTSGDVVVPYFRFIDHTDTPGATVLKEFECGLSDYDVR